MQFTVKSWSRNGRARAGILHLPSSSMDFYTPCLLLSTRKALPHFLSPDLLASLPSPDSHLLQFSPLHFVEGLPTKTISSKCGEVRKMAGLHHYGFVAVPRDSFFCLPEASAANKHAFTDGAVFGAIVGGSSLKERKRCANEVVKRNVSGYWIRGLGLKETIADHPSLLRDVTDLLPIEKPRQVCGLALPEEVLQGVAAGIDIFDSACIYHLTLEGSALTFSINDTQRISCYESSTKINLNAKDYRGDASPIVEGCSCYTCQNHTKAYINHLLNVGEMLAYILLEIHNTHHYLGFFRGIREAINEDRFEQFQNQFINSRQIQQTSIPQYA